MSGPVVAQDPGPYPASRRDRDAWVLRRREGVPRDPDLDPRRPSRWLREEEPDADGRSSPGLTVFLTNRECPWRCLMCDLWRHTLEETVPPGAIRAQIDHAFDAAGIGSSGETGTDWLKLYNAGSFFDAAAIPPGEWPAVAVRAGRFRRLVVESHPALVGPRASAFRDLLPATTRLEVAMGLETAHPVVLDRLNKGVTLEGFRRAAGLLRAGGMGLRVFVLVKPPFMAETEAVAWAVRSAAFAFDCGADVVSLIPTRASNGAMERLRAAGDFAPPAPGTLEDALRGCLALGRGRVFADTWDLGLFEADPERRAAAAERIGRMNATQRPG